MEKQEKSGSLDAEVRKAPEAAGEVLDCSAHPHSECGLYRHEFYSAQRLSIGTKLYAIPEGWQLVPVTPAAQWRKDGQTDPHAGHYDCERAALAMGNLTDDELANAAFMHYDHRPSIADILAGKAHMPIAYMTAVKERIRWLSRALERALAEKPSNVPLDRLAEGKCESKPG